MKTSSVFVFYGRLCRPMVNRKRPIILRCPVTAEERLLIEQKMAQLQTKRIGAYLRKMAMDISSMWTPGTSRR